MSCSSQSIPQKRIKMDSRNRCVCPKMYDFYQADKLCDLILISEQDQTRIATHRVVVSAASEYFEAMFTTSMKEKDMKEVPLGAVSGTILKSLIEYCYTGEFHIDSENVIDALEAARMFRFDNLFASCAKYLKNTLSNESCFKVWNTAILYDLYELATVSLNYICENFWLLIGTEVFCRITAAELMAIFDCNAIAAESEDDLFKSIIKWIEFDVDNRREEFEGLVATIRWSQISHLFLLKDARNALKILGLGDHFDKVCDNAIKSIDSAVKETPRVYANKCIYAISKNQRENEIIVQRYNHLLSSWAVAFSFTENLTCFDVICNNNEIFLIGGRENGVATNKVRCLPLNAAVPVPRQIAPMKYKRYYSASSELLGSVYVTGGDNVSNCHALPLVERLDLTTMEWVDVLAMQQRRSCHGIAALSGKLFVAGGTTGLKILNAVECYDPQLNNWTTVASMNIPRMAHRCLVVGNILYAIGGTNHIGGYLSSIEKYDEVANKWNLMEMGLSVSRCGFGALAMNNWIFVAGGPKDGAGEANEFEKLNLETGARADLPALLRSGSLMYFVEGLHFAKLN